MKQVAANHIQTADRAVIGRQVLADNPARLYRQGHVSLQGARRRARFRLPNIVDSRLRGNDCMSASDIVPATPVIAKAGSGNPWAAFRTHRTPRVQIDP